MKESTLGMALAQRTLELIDVPSPSRGEHAVAGLIESLMPFEPAYAADETLLFFGPRIGSTLVVLAGHLDTVPAQGNLPGSIGKGVVHGLGASDMKGGLAVMIELARWIAEHTPELEVDFAFLFFPREEIALEESPLPAVFESGLLEPAKLVIVLEPTDNTIQLGCLGTINARLRFAGRSAHSARPWLGENAIEKAIGELGGIARIEPGEIEVAGLVFREVLTLTRIEGGIADNVVPDRVEATVNFRYAPGRTEAEALQRLGRLLGSDVDWETISSAPAAHVPAGGSLVARLEAAGPFKVEPKQAWTPVAQFAEQGFDAVNLGPGATRFAHRADEQIEIAELARTFEALRRFAIASR